MSRPAVVWHLKRGRKKRSFPLLEESGGRRAPVVLPAFFLFGTDGYRRAPLKRTAPVAAKRKSGSHAAAAGGQLGGYCAGHCPHLAGGLTSEQLDGLLTTLDTALRSAKEKQADPRLSQDGWIQVRHLERLKEALLADNSDHMDFLDNLFDALERFGIPDPPEDDCTALLVDIHGPLT